MPIRQMWVAFAAIMALYAVVVVCMNYRATVREEAKIWAARPDIGPGAGNKLPRSDVLTLLINNLINKIYKKTKTIIYYL